MIPPSAQLREDPDLSMNQQFVPEIDVFFG
jgi:hypothetical protein